MHPKLLTLLVCFVLFTGALLADDVIVNFDPSTPSVGPFPTDYLTTPNPAQKTGLSVHLPMPDCTAQPSGCTEVSLLNELDGFHLQPRIRVNFSGAVDPTTLKPGIVFVWLDNLTNDEVGQGPSGQISAINQVIYDSATNTAYAKPNDVFDQHRRYALVVTDAVLDAAGNPVAADPNFTNCIQSAPNNYCNGLRQVVRKLGTAALPGNIVAASVFTTMSATAWLEKARDLLPQAPLGYQPQPPSVKAAGITSITLKAQVGTNPATFQNLTLQTPKGTLDGVDRIVFGTYQSPNFLNAGQYIPTTPTATALTLPSTTTTIQFHAYIPSSPMPPGGYPVMIFGHGFESNGFATPTLVASTFAKAGFAILAINAVGHGYGPQTVIELAQQGGVVADFPGSGRGIDMNGDGQIDPAEGCFLAWPYPVEVRDCMRQTVVDLMQLVSLVRGGVAIEPSGDLKFDGGKIYYAGGSLGSMYGTMLLSLDSRVRAAAFSVGGGSIVEINYFAPVYASFTRQLVGGAHTPSFLNAGADFNANYVLRNQPPKVNTVAGAIEIQNMFGDLEWLQAPGDSLSYAPHVSLTPLSSMHAKPALFLYDVGDQSVPNPVQSALIRAAGMFSSSTLYRADLAGPVAVLVCCRLPADSHGFLADNSNPAALIISKSAQQEAVGFLASDGQTIPDANAIFKQLLPFPTSVTIFETPGRDLETLNFGTLGISIQQNLVLDQTPMIGRVASATGIRSSVQPNIQAGSWVTIYGSNLANSTLDWTGLINNGQLPTSLGGVSVTIDGQPAYLYFVSPGQINLQAPAAASGDVQVVVTNNGMSTAAVKVHLGTYAPAFFQWGPNQYAVTTRYPDNAYVGNPSIGVGFVAAKPGDTLILWATGFGPNDPPQAPGFVTSGAHNVAQPVTVTVGGMAATVVGAALSPGLVGVYQIAIQLPVSVPTGDVLLKASVGGSNTPDNVYLFVTP